MSGRRMCGIHGIVGPEVDCARAMAAGQQAQCHRGPDGSGRSVFRVGAWRLDLGHQRLAILDLSSAGAQPMRDPRGEGWIVYNGEIYNYRELRTELIASGFRFHTGTDTEVVLAALSAWGPEGAMSRFNGMWAFAWLDERHQRLVLARDRMGVKPLHLASVRGRLFFASELKTILAMTESRFALDLETVGRFLVQSLTDADERTFIAGTTQLKPGCYGLVDLTAKHLVVDVRSYWSLPEAEAEDGEVREEEVIPRLRELFEDAVRLRLRSDVPVGVLLSGGIDSSAIAAAVNRVAGHDGDVNLLSAVSDDPRYDESPFVDIMARFLGRPVNRISLPIRPEDLFPVLKRACWHNDQPVASLSTVAHYLLMQRARELGVTVLLTGQGADELLCGYRKFLGFYLQELLRRGHTLRAAAVLAEFWRRGTIVHQFSLADAKRYLPRLLRSADVDTRGSALAGFRPLDLGLGPGGRVTARQAEDVRRFSVPALLRYEDRMSMAWSREVRVPFLDYRLVGMLLPLAASFKLRDGWTKYVFRKAMAPLLPKEITWRRDKQGFVTPQGEWLKHELFQTVLSYFAPDSLVFHYKLLDRKNLLEKYERFRRQPADTGIVGFRDIFNPLALEVWLRGVEGYLTAP